MSDTLSITEILGWVTKMSGVGGGTYLGYKGLSVLGAKMNLTLAADRANEKLREDMQKMLDDARSMVREAQADVTQAREELEKKRDEENECRRRLAVAEGRLDLQALEMSDQAKKHKALSDEVGRLRSLLLAHDNPGLEESHEFNARLLMEQAERDDRKGGR